MEILSESDLGEKIDEEQLSKDTLYFINEVTSDGHIEEPKLVGLVIDQLIRSSRAFTKTVFEQIIPIASDLHFNFDDVTKQDRFVKLRIRPYP